MIEPQAGPVRGLEVVDRGGRQLFVLTTAGVLTRVVVVASILLYVVALHAAAPGTPVWPGVVLLLVATAAGEVPDSGVAFVAQAVALSWWALAVDDPTTPWTLLAAAGLLVFHLAVAHAAAGPPGFTVERVVVLRTALAGLVVLAGAAAVWLVAVAAAGAFDAHSVLVAATLLVVGGLSWLAVPRR